MAVALLELRARVEALEELHKAVVDLNERFNLDPLVARVEALEGRELTHRLATLAWGKDVESHGRWIDDHLKRIMALEAGQQPPQDKRDRLIALDAADSLVGRVAMAINPSDGAPLYLDEARAAIRAVASWLKNERQSPLTADVLVQEANQ